jgi:hypothetical protein
MQPPVRIFTLLLALAPLLANAKHVAPPDVQSITNRGVRYVVPNDKGLRAYVQAWDVQTGKRLWEKTVFTHWYIPPFGTECMYYEYVTSMALEKNELILTSERGRVYALDIRTHAVHRIKKRANKALEATAAGPVSWTVCWSHNALVAGARVLPAAVPQLRRSAT